MSAQVVPIASARPAQVARQAQLRLARRHADLVPASDGVVRAAHVRQLLDALRRFLAM